MILGLCEFIKVCGKKSIKYHKVKNIRPVYWVTVIIDPGFIWFFMMSKSVFLVLSGTICAKTLFSGVLSIPPNTQTPFFPVHGFSLLLIKVSSISTIIPGVTPKLVASVQDGVKYNINNIKVRILGE